MRMLSMLAAVVEVLVEGIRILGILAVADGGIHAGDRRRKNCDFVDNPLGHRGLTLDKTKRHPMERCMEG